MDRELTAKCFAENRNLFSHPQTVPEKFNLYNGLENMALMLRYLLYKVDDLEHEIAVLRTELTPGR